MSSDDAWKAEIWTKGFYQVAQFLFFLQRMLQDFPKKGWKTQLFPQQVPSGGESGQGRHKSTGCPPSSDETQALFSSSSDQTLEALLERTAGREGLAVLP